MERFQLAMHRDSCQEGGKLGPRLTDLTPPPDATGPSIFTAIQEQPVEKPSEN
jgi:hypothetical protein